MSAINHHASPFGGVVVCPQGQAVFGPEFPVAVAVEQDRYTWFAPEAIQGNLPDNFRIEFDCCTAADGVRRFLPVGGLEAFIHRGFLAGAAILVHEERLSPQDRNFLYARHHFFQRARRMPEHLNRRFEASRDLYVRTGGRGGHITHNLLPNNVSFAVNSSAPVEIRELTQYGRELARSAGIRAPTNRVAIHYGMVEAAFLHPLQLNIGEVAGLIRAALFDETSTSTIPDADFLDIVTDRVLAWFDSHLHLSREMFDRAFFPGKSNFIKAIADQRTSPGGVLPHDNVRQALLHLGWQSYEDVSMCMARFVSWFLESLPEPLDGAESRLFEQIYLPQPHFGDLPLALLFERSGFIGKVVTGLWENPGDNLLIGALHRLLDNYGQMAANRREADRRFKRRTNARSGTVHEITGQDWSLTTASTFNARNPLFDAIGEHLAIEMGLRCEWCGGNWTARLACPDDVVQQVDGIELEVTCECGRVAEGAAMSVEAFRRLASRFLGD